jgi:eukaryotic-like serine/threonine-protein kinase
MTDNPPKELQLSLEPIEGPKDIRSFTITGRGVITVGRSSSTHLKLPKNDTQYSRLHFVIEFNPPKCRILDLGSRTGTYLNGQKVFSGHPANGDEIRIGKTTFRVLIGQNLSADAKKTSSDENTEDNLAYHALEAERDRKLEARKLREKKLKKKAKQAEKQAAAKAEKRGAAPAKPREIAVAAEDSGKGLNFDLARLLDGEDSSEMIATKNTKKKVVVDDNDDEETVKPLPEIPGYEVLRLMGQDDLGESLLVKSLDNEKLYSVKLLTSERVHEQQAVDAFLMEMQPLMDIEHNHIARYHEFGQSGNFIYIVSEYVKGLNCEDCLHADGPFGVVRLAKLGSQILQGLDYAHGLGHVHRDIKPSNIVITAENNREIAKLVDYGLARNFQNSPLYGVKRKSDLERSVRFMAPEQFQNFKEMPISVDIYSVAATFYYLLTGKYTHDFESLSFDQAVSKIKRDDAYNLSRRRMDVPGELANLIHLALNRFPQKRIATAAAFRKELYKFIK